MLHRLFGGSQLARHLRRVRLEEALRAACLLADVFLLLGLFLGMPGDAVLLLELLAILDARIPLRLRVVAQQLLLLESLVDPFACLAQGRELVRRGAQGAGQFLQIGRGLALQFGRALPEQFARLSASSALQALGRLGEGVEHMLLAGHGLSLLHALLLLRRQLVLQTGHLLERPGDLLL